MVHIRRSTAPMSTERCACVKIVFVRLCFLMIYAIMTCKAMMWTRGRMRRLANDRQFAKFSLPRIFEANEYGACGF